MAIIRRVVGAGISKLRNNSQSLAARRMEGFRWYFGSNLDGKIHFASKEEGRILGEEERAKEAAYIKVYN